MFRTRLVAAAGVLLLVLAGAAASTPNGSPIPFVTIALGKTSRIPKPLQLVVRDRQAWLNLWTRHAGPSGPAPTVDFSREMVIAIFAGASAVPRMVAITRIIRVSEGLTVLYATRDLPLPDAGGLSPSVPFHMVRLVRSTLPVSFSAIKVFPAVPQP